MSSRVDALFREGLAQHAKGKVAEAASIYREVLSRNERHAESLHLLGVIAYQLKRHREAESLILKALGESPTLSAAHSNLGNVYQQMKRFADAVASYDKAIALQPNYAEAHSNRGNALLELERVDEAIAAYERALALKPNLLEAYVNRANALQRAGRFEMAVADYDKALSLKSDRAEIHSNRGNALFKLGRLEEALESYEQALVINPAYAVGFSNLGNLQHRLGRLEESLASCDRALSLEPGYAEAHSNRGNALLSLNRLPEAVASYDRALALKPGYAEAQSNRAAALLRLRRYEDALAAADKALAIRPDYPDAWSNRGVALHRLQRFDDAVASFDAAIRFKPGYAEAHYNRGNVLRKLRRFSEAVQSFDLALAARPHYPDALGNRGNALQELGRYEEALASYDAAIAQNGDDFETLCNKGLLYLLQGEFDRGWSLYENRKRKRRPAGHAEFPKPLWLGEQEISGKTILVHHEQGLGDTIHFCRYIQLLDRRGANVLFAPQKVLSRLMATLDARCTLIDDAAAATLRFDYHAPLLSLPYAFRTDADTIPAGAPYLRADALRVEIWKARLGSHGFKVGVNWRGSQAGAQYGRSVPLSLFEPLSRIDGVRLISLQKGDGEEELARAPKGMRIETLGPDFDVGDDAFLDSAAVMEALDLVITSDTAIAHLAGALGKPVWIALKFFPDWRWGLHGERSAWYPSVRLFRQRTDGDWETVFSDIGAALEPLARQRQLPAAADLPEIVVSWGEVVDRLTRLEIQCGRSQDPQALNIARRELDRLNTKLSDQRARLIRVAGLRRQLARVNEGLWKIDDRMRAKAAQNAFDDEVAGLVRSAYLERDKRADIRRQIDDELRSPVSGVAPPAGESV